MLNYLSDKVTVKNLAKLISDISRDFGALKIMHVCGTHEQAISRFGLRSFLPENLEVVSGPGCPVCCTPAFDIDHLVELSLNKNAAITCYGDMLKVRGSHLSLADAKAKGAKVKIVYSILDALDFAKAHKDLEVVHSAIGFETTAPTTAVVLAGDCPENFSLLCSHRLIPPAMDSLLAQRDNNIDGFIAPGHVSVVIGGKAYEDIPKRYNKPVVISGFEPADILYSIYLIAKQIKENRARVEIEYSRVVNWLPQKNALSLMNKVFEVRMSFWRGIGKIADSGLVLKKRYKKFDALDKFGLKKRQREEESFKNCLCAEVLKGKIHPNQCPSFAKACNPEHPLGPCMVSYEGSCAIFYLYRGNNKFSSSKTALQAMG